MGSDALGRLLESRASLPEAFFATAEACADRPAQWVRQAAGYAPIPYRELAERARRIASGLIRAGLAAGDRVALLMENRPEWAAADFGILAAGGVCVPLYTTARVRDLAFVLRDSGARFALVSGGRLRDRLVEAAADAPAIERIFALDSGPGAQPWATLVAEDLPDAVAHRIEHIDRSALASLVYTSGTTGDPKGVMLSHGNFLANVEGAQRVAELRAEDRMLSFLPLAHALERTAGHFLPYLLGLSVAFAERPDTVAKNMAEARPTLLITVPRLLEVVRARVLTQAAKQTGIARLLFERWLALAPRARRGELGALGRGMAQALDRVVAARVRERFGGRLRLIVSGGAPLAPEVGAFFADLGLTVVEGYGLTEAAPVLTVNPPSAPRFGTVGQPLPNVELRIAEDGEILARGPNVMQGYWQRDEETRRTIDAEGWLHTGDVGAIDADGYLTITDRKKDLIVNSGGENIAPQRIEARLMADPYIEQAVVYGDRRPYLVALIAPNREACEQWARNEGLPEADWAALARSAALRRMLQTRINRLLAGFPAHEQVRRILVLDTPLDIESGLLTPTLKVKRKRVYERFGEALEALYG